MRSVLHVTIGNPKCVPTGILIPMGMMISDDNSDDTDVPNPSYTWMNAYVSHVTISKGPDFIKQSALNLLIEQRFAYSSVGYGRIADALISFLDKTDLSVYNIGWFPDPLTPTVH